MLPLLLRPDNFTPPSRTPWGGRHIVERFKPSLASSTRGVVGESWELSLDPTFPSRAHDGRTLAEHTASAPDSWFGAAAPGGSSLLVKLLDAADTLSVQVHPADSDPALGPTESGKPEAWVVLHAEPGAGLWLGLTPSATRERVAQALAAPPELVTTEMRELLHFERVTAGDVFIIEPGTIHAIGAGVTVLEPQRVAPGKSGVTYRLWDWARRYDEHGRLDASGAPRALHPARSLAVVRWDGLRGSDFVAAIRCHPVPLQAPPPLRHARLLDDLAMRLDHLSGTGRMAWQAVGALSALTVLGGRLSLGGVIAAAGETLAVPASFAGELVLDGVNAYHATAFA